MDSRPKTIPFGTTATTTRPKTIPFSSTAPASDPVAPKEKGLGAKLGQRLEEGGAGILDQFQKPSLMSPARLFSRPLGAAGRAVGDVADAVISPVIDKTVDLISDIPAVQKFAMKDSVSGGLDAVNSTIQKGVEGYDKFAEANPEVAKDISDIEGISNLFLAGQAKKPAITAVKSTIPKASEATISSRIASDFNKSVKPSIPATTKGAMEKQGEKVVEAVRLINENKPNLTFVDEAGEVVTGQAPRTRLELADAVDQTKKNIFTQYNSLAEKAGDIGLKIQTNPIVKELKTVIENPSMQLTNPEAVKYAQTLLDRYSQIGDLTPDVAQDVIKNLNESLKAFYRNPTYPDASKAAIDALVANNLRKLLDEGIEGLTGANYASLKQQYGALKSVEKDVLRAAAKQMKQGSKGLIDYTDIFTGGDILHGVLTLNPATVARGTFSRGIKEFYKYLNDPDRAIENMFKNAGKFSPRIFKGAERPTPLALPAAGETANSTPMYATQGGKISPVLQEASDASAIESGRAAVPQISPLYAQKVQEIQNRLEPYFTPEEMKIIQMGPKPKSDLGLPNAPDTPPNVYVNPQRLKQIEMKLERYLTPEEMQIIEWGPGPKKPPSSLNDIYIE